MLTNRETTFLSMAHISIIVGTLLYEIKHMWVDFAWAPSEVHWATISCQYSFLTSSNLGFLPSIYWLIQDWKVMRPFVIIDSKNFLLTLSKSLHTCQFKPIHILDLHNIIVVNPLVRIIAKLHTLGKWCTTHISLDVKLNISMCTYLFSKTSIQTDKMLQNHKSLNRIVPTCKGPNSIHTYI